MKKIRREGAGARGLFLFSCRVSSFEARERERAGEGGSERGVPATHAHQTPLAKVPSSYQNMTDAEICYSYSCLVSSLSNSKERQVVRGYQAVAYRYQMYIRTARLHRPRPSPPHPFLAPRLFLARSSDPTNHCPLSHLYLPPSPL